MKKQHLWKSVTAGVLALVMTVLLLSGAIPTPVRAESSSEIRNQINSLEQEKANLQAQIDALEQQKQENLTEIQVTLYCVNSRRDAQNSNEEDYRCRCEFFSCHNFTSECLI